MKRFFIILLGALCLCGHAAAQTQADFSRLTEDNHPRLLFTDKSFKDLKGIIRGAIVHSDDLIIRNSLINQ